MGFKDKMQINSNPNKKVRTSSDYLKVTSEHPTIIRVMDEEPETCWVHFIPKGFVATGQPVNKGKGMGIICPGPRDCPVCAWNKEQLANNPDDKTKIRKASKKFAVNVLDRTPVLVCSECGYEHYEISGKYPSICQNSECGEPLMGEPVPRNKIQILQKGKTFSDQFIALEEEYGPITQYDIKLVTKGKGTEARTVCIVQPPTEIDYDSILGPDWEEQKYDLVKVTQPLTVEQIKRIFAGENYFDVVTND